MDCQSDRNTDKQAVDSQSDRKTDKAGRQAEEGRHGWQTEYVPEVSTGLRGASGDAGLATNTLQHEHRVMHNLAMQYYAAYLSTL